MKIKALFFALAITVVGSTAYSLSWQTEPIMGYDAIVTGVAGERDLTIVTGPTPIKSDGSFYDSDLGEMVLGPTIPHYSVTGDPLEGVGDPSVEEFFFNPDTWNGSHWYDPNTAVYHGSGINIIPYHWYGYSYKWEFLDPENPYWFGESKLYMEEEGREFVMYYGSIRNFWREDAGDWRYTETWLEMGTGEYVEFTRNFTTTAVPGPATIYLLGSGLIGLCGIIRTRKKNITNI